MTEEPGARPPGEDDASPRSRVARAALRCALVYWLLYFPVLALDDLPGGRWIIARYNDVWAAFIPWLTTRVLRIDHSYPDTGELRVDCSYAYAHDAIAAFAAVAIGLAVSRLEERRGVAAARTRLARAHDVVRVLLRYGLAAAMFHYGVPKLVGGQFGPPAMRLYVEPLAEWSRMTLLWTFMGASTAYTVFTGVVETAAGVLVLWRRTTTLGALLGVLAMTNVVALDVAYDVPVKLHAANLLEMSAFLAAPDAPRIARAILGPAGAPARPRVAKAAKAVFLVVVAACAVARLREWRRGLAITPPFHGIWEVDSFRRDGVEVPPLATDATRWRRVAFDRADDASESYVTVWRMTEDHAAWDARIDEASSVITMRAGSDAADMPWKYARPDADHLVLEGPLDGVATHVALHRVPDERFKSKRPTRWVRERVVQD